MGLDTKPSQEETVGLVAERVANCYAKHKLCCSESIMYVLSKAFPCALSGREAVQLGAGYCHGIGGAGCSCGALTGAVALLSYYLAPHADDGLKKRQFRKCIKEMHDQFKDRFRSTCCRVLSKKPKEGQRRFSCKDLTVGAAEIATHLLLKARPELLNSTEIDFLKSRELVL